MPNSTTSLSDGHNRCIFPRRDHIGIESTMRRADLVVASQSMRYIPEIIAFLAFDSYEKQNYLFFRLLGSKNYHSQKYKTALFLYRQSFFILASTDKTSLLTISQDLHRIARTFRRLGNFYPALEIYSGLLSLFEARNYLNEEFISAVRQYVETYWENGLSNRVFAFLKEKQNQMAKNTSFPIGLRIALILLEAECYGWLADIAGAEQAFKNASAAIKTAQNDTKKLERHLLWHRGLIRKDLGDYQGALNDWSLLLDDYRASSNLKAECRLLPSIGFLQRILGNFQASLCSYTKGLQLAKEIQWDENSSQKSFEAFSVNNIGIVHTALGNFPEATAAYRSSLKISEIIENYESKAYSLGGFGWLSFEQGDYNRAKEYYESSIDIFQQLNKDPPPPVLISLSEVEMRLSRSGWKGRAFSLISQAEGIAERTTSEVNKVRAKLGRAAITARDGHGEKALQLCNEAHQLAQEIGFFEGKATSQLLGARICLENMETSESNNEPSLARSALKFLQKTKNYAEAVDAVVLVLEAMGAESAVREALEDFSTALDVQKNALSLAKSTGLPNMRYQIEIERLETYQRVSYIYKAANKGNQEEVPPLRMRDALDYLQGAFRILKAYSAPHSEIGSLKDRKSDSIS